MRAHLITHAHTRQQPHVDSRKWELSPEGEQQAHALLDGPFWSEVEAIIVSSEPKTRLTAQPAALRHGLEIVEDARLDELRRGGWIEDYAATVAEALRNPTASIAGWESAESAQTRAIEALVEVGGRYPNGTVAVVGHGISLSLVRAWVLGYATVRIPEWQGLPFGAWATVNFAGRSIERDFAFGPGIR